MCRQRYGQTDHFQTARGQEQPFALVRFMGAARAVRQAIPGVPWRFRCRIPARAQCSDSLVGSRRHAQWTAQAARETRGFGPRR